MVASRLGGPMKTILGLPICIAGLRGIIAGGSDGLASFKGISAAPSRREIPLDSWLPLSQDHLFYWENF